MYVAYVHILCYHVKKFGSSAVTGLVSKIIVFYAQPLLCVCVCVCVCTNCVGTCIYMYCTQVL